MIAVKFRKEVIETLQPARGTYIFEASTRDLDEKTSPEDPCNYRGWLERVVRHCRDALSLTSVRILDIGCGNGEFTTMLSLMGYEVVGLDVNERALGLARILAEENGISPGRFVRAEGRSLPFEDSHFDLGIMISSLEHMDDDSLRWLVPELARVCRGLFVQVPSAMKVSDDHTGLRFVPWMPSWLARHYVALRGRRYRYLISDSGRWDVHYRNLGQIERRFSALFEVRFAPLECSYPPCGGGDEVLDLKRSLRIRGRCIGLRIPLIHRRIRMMLGTPREFFYPYYNLVLRTR